MYSPTHAALERSDEGSGSDSSDGDDDEEGGARRKRARASKSGRRSGEASKDRGASGGDKAGAKEEEVVEEEEEEKDEEPLPPGWTAHERGKKGTVGYRVYYLQQPSGRRVWDRPTAASEKLYQEESALAEKAVEAAKEGKSDWRKGKGGSGVPRDSTKDAFGRDAKGGKGKAKGAAAAAMATPASKANGKQKVGTSGGADSDSALAAAADGKAGLTEVSDGASGAGVGGVSGGDGADAVGVGAAVGSSVDGVMHTPKLTGAAAAVALGHVPTPQVLAATQPFLDGLTPMTVGDDQAGLREEVRAHVGGGVHVGCVEAGGKRVNGVSCTSPCSRYNPTCSLAPHSSSFHLSFSHRTSRPSAI